MILDAIKEDLPKNAMISDMSYEGSEIILYTKNKEFFNESTDLIKKIVNKIKKRIEVRADRSIVMDEEKTIALIKKLIPEEAGVKDIYFEPEFAKVVIHAEKPGLVIGKSGETLLSIKEKTFWTPHIYRAPVIDSELIKSIRKMLHKDVAYRKKFLNKLGEKIYSEGKEVEWIRLTGLGSFREVGRSCILLQTPQTRVLLDCGMAVSLTATKPYPYLDVAEFNVQTLDAVILSHAHMDHCLPPETLVTMADGRRKLISEIKKGDELLSVDWKSGKMSSGRCSGKNRTRIHKKIYKIRTSQNAIEASPNHRFFVYRDNEIKEVEAQELRLGELIPVISQENETGLSSVAIGSGNLLLNLKIKGILWQKITGIEMLENPYSELIDIEVLPHRNFVAEGVIVHNCGMVPFLYDYGYRGPVYCTRPTRDIAALMQLDYIQICQRENRKAFYSSKGIEEAIRHTITLEYGEVTDIAPDMRITLQNAGHLLGSSSVHIHIGEGLYNLVYSGDIKYENTKLFEKAFTDYARAEAVIIESTYGASEGHKPTHKDGELSLVQNVRRALERGGRVLIPSFAVGRSQDVITILTETDIDVPIYLDGMIWDTTAIHTAYPEYMSKYIQTLVLHKGKNPFIDPRLRGIGSSKEREIALNSTEPGIIISTSGMLMGGPAIEYLQALAGDERNMILFVGYQAEGTPGRRIQKGWKEVQMDNGKTLELKLEIATVSGLGGHSDGQQILNYLQHFKNKPRKIIVNHGDGPVAVDFARTIHKLYRIESVAPRNLETIRLR